MCLDWIFHRWSGDCVDSSSAFILGPSQSGKSSLLFRFGQTSVQKHPKTIALIVRPDPMDQLPVPIAQMPPISFEQAEYIRFVYLSTLEQLFDFVSRLFAIDLQFSSLCIDDLDVFMMRRSIIIGSDLSTLTFDQAFGRLLAVLHDTLSHCQLTSGQSGRHSYPRLLITATPDRMLNYQLLDLCYYYFDHVYTIDAVRSNASQSKGASELIKVIHRLQEAQKGICLTFKCTRNCLQLLTCNN
jgi:hypothetical protein